MASGQLAELAARREALVARWGWPLFVQYAPGNAPGGAFLTSAYDAPGGLQIVDLYLDPAEGEPEFEDELPEDLWSADNQLRLGWVLIAVVMKRMLRGDLADAERIVRFGGRFLPTVDQGLPPEQWVMAATDSVPDDRIRFSLTKMLGEAGFPPRKTG